jgi:hypothetical protein
MAVAVGAAAVGVGSGGLVGDGTVVAVAGGTGVTVGGLARIGVDDGGSGVGGAG